MKFIILSQQRSGSHMLMNLLNSHPDIHCNSDSQTIDIQKNGKQWAYDAGFKSDSKVRGFLLKIKTNLHKEITANENIKIIYLKRENFLHILLSKKMAKLFGCYEKVDVGISLKNARISRKKAQSIVIDAEEAKKFFIFWKKRHKDVKDYIDTAGLEYMEIKYCDLCNDTDKAMKKIYNFLSIDSAPLHFTPGRGSEKLDPRPSGMAINNYYDLKEYFIKDNILTESIWYKFFEDYK
jgi:LPS sulfotransferase NodH